MVFHTGKSIWISIAGSCDSLLPKWEVGKLHLPKFLSLHSSLDPIVLLPKYYSMKWHCLKSKSLWHYIDKFGKTQCKVRQSIVWTLSMESGYQSNPWQQSPFWAFPIFSLIYKWVTIASNTIRKKLSFGTVILPICYTFCIKLHQAPSAISSPLDIWKPGLYDNVW